MYEDRRARVCRPLHVADTDGGKELVVTATVRDGEPYPELVLTATCAGEKVLGMAVATVRALAPAR